MPVSLSNSASVLVGLVGVGDGPAFYQRRKVRNRGVPVEGHVLKVLALLPLGRKAAVRMSTAARNTTISAE
jgi:hypothetical protein